MTSRDFAYWLQGFFELNSKNSSAQTLDQHQTKMVKDHLNLVFAHEIDPSFGNEDERSELQKIHDGLQEKIKRPRKTVPLGQPPGRSGGKIMC